MADIGNLYTNFARYSADLSLFLLVAEVGQLSRAAELAGLSQPRLSQRIKSLEESLGQPLFDRQRRGMTLTPAGRDMHTELAPLLGKAAQRFARLQTRPRTRTVVIETDLAFASFRFLPVFPSLCAAHPELSLSLLTRQLPNDDTGPRADLRIRMEPRAPDSATRRCLFAERVQVVGSPEFLARHPRLSNPAQLHDLPLIELVSDTTPPWVTWSGWFRQLGLAPPAQADRIQFNSYDHVIQSAERGLGLALGWRGLVDSRIEAGALRPALSCEVTSPLGYVLSLRAQDPDSAIQGIFDWICGTFAPAAAP